MANLQVKGVDDSLYQQLKERAQSENRSVSQELIFLLKLHLAMKKGSQQDGRPAQVLLDLAGSWEDRRPADRIVKDLRQARKASRKLADGF